MKLLSNYKSIHTLQVKQLISKFVFTAFTIHPSQNVCPQGSISGILGPIGRKSIVIYREQLFSGIKRMKKKHCKIHQMVINLMEKKTKNIILYL